MINQNFTKIFLILSMATLTSCYDAYYNNKSAPNNYSKIQTALVNQGKKPVPGTYSVYGKSYKVLKTNKNYEEVGIASWYGKQFQHRYTSSGERFNMYKLTAAHKTLPLLTYVVVTNLKNHKKVVVKITDRGPFVGERVIDLSYAAAKELGMVGRGVAEVNIKSIAHV